VAVFLGCGGLREDGARLRAEVVRELNRACTSTVPVAAEGLAVVGELHARRYLGRGLRYVRLEDRLKDESSTTAPR
jgi:lipocalin